MFWVVSIIGWLLALGALATARRLSRRLAQLTELYWELKYEQGELKQRIKTLAPMPDDAAAAPPPPVKESFIPLSSMKKS